MQQMLIETTAEHFEDGVCIVQSDCVVEAIFVVEVDLDQHDRPKRYLENFGIAAIIFENSGKKVRFEPGNKHFDYHRPMLDEDHIKSEILDRLDESP